MINRSEDPANSFQTKIFADLVDLILKIIYFELNWSHLSSLRRLIYSFHNSPNTILIIWIFSVVTIQESDSLFHFTFRTPILDKIGHFRDIQKFDVIDMPEREISFLKLYSTCKVIVSGQRMEVSNCCTLPEGTEDDSCNPF